MLRKSSLLSDRLLPPLFAPLGALAAGIALPVVLLPLIQLFGYSIVVEEIAKAVAIWLFLRVVTSRPRFLAAGLLIGLGFGISETVLYVSNAFAVGVFAEIGQRLLFTTPFHGLTTLLLAWAAWRSPYLLVPALLVTLTLHTAYNTLIQ